VGERLKRSVSYHEVLMGYEVHIIRKSTWFEEDGPIISLKEWLDYVSSDSEMRADGDADT
jgi:hypothetical protein